MHGVGTDADESGHTVSLLDVSPAGGKYCLLSISLAGLDSMS